MIDLGFFDPSIIASNLLGGLIALVIAIGVSRWEFNRQAENRRKNWYRSVHTVCVRATSTTSVNHRLLDDKKAREYGRQYRSFSDQLNELLKDAPTDEVDLPLFNSLQNIEVSFVRYARESEANDIRKASLDNYHDTIIDFGLIARYIIEREKDIDVELLDEMDGDELNDAQEMYEKFIDGTLYDEQNERAKKVMEILNNTK